jgi:MFS superfamily sulfate permease-like transporter
MPDRADVLPVGPNTSPVPRLLILRLDGALYTANVRSVNRKVLDIVDQHADTQVLVVDTTAQTQLPVTVINEVEELERELLSRHVELWIVGLPPRARHTAEQLPRWTELQRSGRIHDSSLAAVRAHQKGS